MKKVGIVSCYFKNNYGSMLQAYATQKFLELNKIPNETIDISDLKDFKVGKRKYYLSQITNFNFIKSKSGMIKLKLHQKTNSDLKKNFGVRNRKFNEFKQRFNLSRTFNSYADISSYSKEMYSDVIVGSDQLWLPVNVVSDYYTLNWVPDSVNKISFATSFGISSIPKKYEDQYAKFLNRIENLSVRESNAVSLIKDLINKDAKLVCDPTLLLNKEQWLEIQEDEPILDEKYIFCYFLGNNIEHRKFVERLKEVTGYKIVSINHCDEYVKYSDSFADIIPYDVGPSEFVNYIRNAEFVCTDSFHGTVFSLINNTKFFTFERFNKSAKMSTNSRIYSLLEIVDLKDRLLSGNEEVKDVIDNKIDFTKVNKKLEEFREESATWLLDAIVNKPIDTNEKFVTVTNKEMCTGCTACAASCPKNAITMKRDEEGFLYPVVDPEKCINCGICKRTCPLTNKKTPKKFEQKAFVFQHENDVVRKESTSGGAFTAIAEHVIDEGGVVFGVAFDEDYKARHTYVETKEELWKFRNSKYVQSDPENSFRTAKEFLDEGRLVLFSGTSCQIAGIKHFLKKNYDNLILVDVVCRAVPSPLMWEKYLEFRKEKYPEPQKIYFREKTHGYKYSNLSIYDKTNEYHNGIDSDPYLRAFFSNICDRPSCYSCKFKTQYRESDLTIWDCFNIDKFDSKMDDDKGTTRILCHNEKGLKIMNEIAKKNICKEIDVKAALSDFNGIFAKVRYNNLKDSFVKDMNSLKGKELFEKYFPETAKTKLEKNTRKFLLKTGLYKKIISLAKKVRKRK